MSGMLLWVHLALASIEVSGTTTCPAASDVARRLERLRPRGPAGVTGHRAVLSRGARGVALELRDPAGALLATRTLGSIGRCAELAEACAVVLSTWEAELEVTASSLPALPAPPALPATPSKPIEEPAPAPVEEEPPPPAPTHEAARPYTPQPAVELGAALTGSFAGGMFSIGGQLFVSVVPSQSGWGGQLGLAALGARTVSAGADRVQWERYAIRIGPEYRVPAAGLRLDFHVDGLLALLAITGEDATASQSSLAFDPGLGGGLRLSSPVGLWLGVSGAAWFRRHQVTFTAPEAYMLPQVELLLAVGFAVGGS